MIYTTLKENRKNNIDLALYCEETIFVVANLLPDSEKYYDEWEETDFDKVYIDYSEQEIESIVLKRLKEYAKENDSIFLIWDKYIIDIEYGIPEIENMIKKGYIKTEEDLLDIHEEALKKGFFMKEKCWEDEFNYNIRTVYDLIKEYFSLEMEEL